MQIKGKSLYDPCPHLYRIPSNGTYNLFPNTYTAWTINSYLGGAKWTRTNSTWLPSTGLRYYSTGLFYGVGYVIGYRTATPSATAGGYVLEFRYDKTVYLNNGWARANGITIRCIEDERFARGDKKNKIPIFQCNKSSKATLIKRKKILLKNLLLFL